MLVGWQRLVERALATAAVGLPWRFWSGGVATLAQWRCRGVDNGKEGPWRWWAYRGVVGGATSTRWRSKRAAVGMSQRCRGGRHGSSCAALTGQEGSGVGLKKRSDNQHVVGGGVWQGAGVEGARRPPRPPSETTPLALAEALRRLSSQGWTCGGDDGRGGDVIALAATRADVGRRD